ncbi:hypothetical protein U1Q18_047194 [Sarracenia purpurea var. burkii]
MAKYVLNLPIRETRHLKGPPPVFLRRRRGSRLRRGSREDQNLVIQNLMVQQCSELALCATGASTSTLFKIRTKAPPLTAAESLSPPLALVAPHHSPPVVACVAPSNSGALDGAGDLGFGAIKGGGAEAERCGRWVTEYEQSEAVATEITTRRKEDERQILSVADRATRGLNFFNFGHLKRKEGLKWEITDILENRIVPIPGHLSFLKEQQFPGNVARTGFLSRNDRPRGRPNQNEGWPIRDDGRRQDDRPR